MSNIIFSFSNFTLSPFSVGAVFLPQHGKIPDEILDELLTRKYKLILVTLSNSLSCSARAFLPIDFQTASIHPCVYLTRLHFSRRGCRAFVLSASSRTTSPLGPSSVPIFSEHSSLSAVLSAHWMKRWLLRVHAGALSCRGDFPF